MAVRKELSLLPEESNNNSFTARLIRYLTTVGRYIIVFTELIVISAFVSRFWLDRQNSDLAENIRQQKAILESTTEFETEYISLQSRLKYIDTQYKAQPKYVANIKSISSSLPQDVFLQNLSFSESNAQISVYSYQEDSLVNLIVNLSLNPDISAVDIRKIEKKTKDTRYFVDISLKFNNKNGGPTI